MNDKCNNNQIETICYKDKLYRHFIKFPYSGFLLMRFFNNISNSNQNITIGLRSVFYKYNLKVKSDVFMSLKD